MINFGTRSPKVIAKIMSSAIEPSVSVAPMSSDVLCELLVSCKRPLAILNIKTPGIIETLEIFSRRSLRDRTAHDGDQRQQANAALLTPYHPGAGALSK